MDKTSSKILLIVLVVVLATGVWLGVRLILGGPEDAWICADGEWVMRGAPGAPKPAEPCGEEPVFCAQDAKLCADGSYVARVAPDCEFAPCPKEDLIRVESPAADTEVPSPIAIRGEARGTWYFEASFPVKLYNKAGELIVQSYATAQGEWMTENFVPFTAELEYSVDSRQAGTLVLEKDNPSGLPENSDEIRIPVVLVPAETRKIKLFYYNSEQDKDAFGNIRCSRQGIVPVEREIPATITPIQDAINLLLSGALTEEERERGIGTEYPLSGLALKGAALDDGTLTLEFDDPENKTSGGSCRVGILWFQIEATALEFPEVQSVRFLPEEIFQP